MPTPETTWETGRLVARPARIAHAECVFEHYANDPAVAKYATWKPHGSVEETLKFLRRCEQDWADGTAFTWILWLKSTGDLTGLIAIRQRGCAVDLGYALSRRWWGQGFMSEAVTYIMKWAFSQPEIYRIWATCDIENVASARLLERVGMEREGILRRWLVHPNISDTPRDCLCYSAVKE